MPPSRRPGFVQTIIIGIVAFVLPALVVLFLFRQGIDLLAEPSQKLSRLIPFVHMLGPVGEIAVGILILLAIAWVAGLLATTGLGRMVSARLSHSPLYALPPLTFARALAASFGTSEEKVSVVLVPSDQGKTLAFLFGATDGETLCVYVPSAPNWTSGSVSFARREDVEFTELSFLEATRILVRLGAQEQVAAARLMSGGKRGSVPES